MNELANANLTQEEYEKDMYDAYLDNKDAPCGECAVDDDDSDIYDNFKELTDMPVPSPETIAEYEKDFPF